MDGWMGEYIASVIFKCFYFPPSVKLQNGYIWIQKCHKKVHQTANRKWVAFSTRTVTLGHLSENQTRCSDSHLRNLCGSRRHQSGPARLASSGKDKRQEGDRSQIRSHGRGDNHQNHSAVTHCFFFCATSIALRCVQKV